MNILRSFTNNETVDYQEFHQLGRLKQYDGEVIRENGRVFWFCRRLIERTVCSIERDNERSSKTCRRVLLGTSNQHES